MIIDLGDQALTTGNVENWGETARGEMVQRIHLSNGALKLSMLTYGATVQNLRMEGHAFPLVLGLGSIGEYETQRNFFGATVGRCANRITKGQCTIGGKAVQLGLAAGDTHHLHGGPEGFSTKIWEIEEVSADRVVLSLTSPDGEMGYPGNLTALAIYQLSDDNALEITLEGTSDALTLCNLTNHSYFNLQDGGTSDINAHELQLDAARYTQVDENLAPTGLLPAVAGTALDFQAQRSIDDFTAYDVNLCLNDAQRALQTVGRLVAPKSGISMEIATTEPGIQLYGSAYLAAGIEGLDGIKYHQGSGVCLETQIWPDAVNHLDFPNVLLEAGKVSRQVTHYRFAR